MLIQILEYGKIDWWGFLILLVIVILANYIRKRLR
jgi:hypothetical protein